MSDEFTLTDAERETLDAAIAIILGKTRKGASWMLDARHSGEVPVHDAAYFTSISHKQHSFCPGKTFSDRIQYALDREAEEQAEPYTAKVRRIERLREELAELEARDV